jgi:DNA-binding ferritin-like protein
MVETRGLLAPQTEAEVRERFEALGPVAQTVTREVARAMELSTAEYDERVTSDVVGTAREALFASVLEVTVGDYDEFEAARDDHPDADVYENGSADVDRAAWHYVPFADALVAATFQNEPDAAVATLRRIAFSRFYQDAL